MQLLDFAQRLQPVLRLPAECPEQLAEALQPLLDPAGVGAFSDEARLLYDLQKACIAQEQEIRRINLVQWLLARGKRPLDRPLPPARVWMVDKLAEAGFDPVYGARPLKRAIQQRVENPLAQEILKGKFKPGDTIEVAVAEDALEFQLAA